MSTLQCAETICCAIPLLSTSSKQCEPLLTPPERSAPVILPTEPKQRCTSCLRLRGFWSYRAAVASVKREAPAKPCEERSFPERTTGRRVRAAFIDNNLFCQLFRVLKLNLISHGRPVMITEFQCVLWSSRWRCNCDGIQSLKSALSLPSHPANLRTRLLAPS